MRTVYGLALTLTVVCTTAPAVRADAPDTAQAVLDAAIKAQGGEAALVKAQTARRKATGVQIQAGREVPFTSEDVLSLPDRFRMDFTLDKRYRFINVIDGTKGWTQIGGGPVLDLSAPRLKEFREEMYVWWIATLAPLKKGGFELTLLPEIKVGGKPAVGIKVASKGHGEVKLYFDKGAHLLVKVERRASASGLMVNKEYFYSNYKEFDGVKLRTREQEKINGKTAAVATEVSYTLLPRVEDKVFRKP